MGLCEHTEVHQGQVQGVSLGLWQSIYVYRLGEKLTESCLEKEDLGILVDEKPVVLTCSSESLLYPRMQKRGCVQGELGGCPPLLCSHKASSGVLHPSLGLQPKDAELTEHVWRRSMKIIRGLEHSPMKAG